MKVKRGWFRVVLIGQIALAVGAGASGVARANETGLPQTIYYPFYVHAQDGQKWNDLFTQLDQVSPSGFGWNLTVVVSGPSSEPPDSPTSDLGIAMQGRINGLKNRGVNVLGYVSYKTDCTACGPSWQDMRYRYGTPVPQHAIAAYARDMIERWYAHTTNWSDYFDLDGIWIDDAARCAGEICQPAALDDDVARAGWLSARTRDIGARGVLPKIVFNWGGAPVELRRTVDCLLANERRSYSVGQAMSKYVTFENVSSEWPGSSSNYGFLDFYPAERFLQLVYDYHGSLDDISGSGPNAIMPTAREAHNAQGLTVTDLSGLDLWVKTEDASYLQRLWSNVNGGYTYPGTNPSSVVSHCSATSCDANCGRCGCPAPSNYTASDLNGNRLSDFILLGGSGWGYSVPMSFNSWSANPTSMNVTTVQETWVTGAVPSGRVMSGDFDGDGLGDLIGWSADYPDMLRLGYAWGSSSFAFSYSFAVASGWSASTATAQLFAVGDFDGDGRSDVAAATPGGYSINILHNKGASNFYWAVENQSNWIPYYVTGSTSAMVAGDYNGDGRDDIAFIGSTGWWTIAVAFASSNGTFVDTNYPVDMWQWIVPSKYLGGDFDGDGLSDIVATGKPGWHSICVFRSLGDGHFAVTNVINSEHQTWADRAAETGAKIVSGDFNGDRKTDLAVFGGQGRTSVMFAYSNGDGTFNVVDKTDGQASAWAAYAGAPNAFAVSDHIPIP